MIEMKNKQAQIPTDPAAMDHADWMLFIDLCRHA
jgi:hypothetical protein